MDEKATPRQVLDLLFGDLLPDHLKAQFASEVERLRQPTAEEVIAQDERGESPHDSPFMGS